jgi:hypothetical protein
MRNRTRVFIAEHRGEQFIQKTATLEFISLNDGSTIPGDIAEELDRLNKFKCNFSMGTGWKAIFTLI